MVLLSLSSLFISSDCWLSFLTGLVGEKEEEGGDMRKADLSILRWLCLLFLGDFSWALQQLLLWRFGSTSVPWMIVFQPSAPFLTSLPPKRGPLSKFSVSVSSPPGHSPGQETGRLQPHTSLSSVNLHLAQEILSRDDSNRVWECSSIPVHSLCAPNRSSVVYFVLYISWRGTNPSSFCPINSEETHRFLKVP